MANLTQIEFLDIADIYPTQLNIWCTVETPIQILGVTVPVLDISGEDIRDTLLQIQTITLPIDNDPGTTVELLITSRVLRGTAPNRYYFFTVVPKDVNSYVDPQLNETIPAAEVVLLPNTRDGSFYISEYNTVLNTVQDNRASEYIFQDNTIALANIQDSLYSDTGWTNARYNGTITTKDTYTSIDSAIVGGSFQGTYYPVSTPDSEIASYDVSERSYLEYFHTGIDTYPEYTTGSIALWYLFENADTTQEYLVVKAPLTNKPLQLYQPGDLIFKQGGTEVLKVLDMYRRTTDNDYRIDVIRGWNNTTRNIFTTSPQDELLRINQVRLFELEGNKPSPVRRGKIRIKDTGHIMYVDRSGYIISGSIPTV
jgi:hypothetical protein